MVTSEQVLYRFRREVTWATHQVQSQFGEVVASTDDVRQEAGILILTYAGLLPGRHSGKLAKFEALAEGNDARVHRLLAATLRLDLYQLFGRKLDPLSAISLDTLTGTKYEPSDESSSMEDQVTRKHSFARELPRLRRDYPYLIAHVIDELLEREIAAKFGVSEATVDRHIAQEKIQAAKDPYFWPLDKDGEPTPPKTPGHASVCSSTRTRARRPGRQGTMELAA